MNTKQIFKNQDLFSWVYLDEPITAPYQLQVAFNSDFRNEIRRDIESRPEVRIDPEKYAEYQLSIEVGKQFFYTAFIRVMPYKTRIAFLDWQLEQCDQKTTFLYRVESLSQVDYWYSFGEHSFYNPAVEEIIGDWCVAKHLGKEPKQRPVMEVIKGDMAMPAPEIIKPKPNKKQLIALVKLITNKIPISACEEFETTGLMRYEGPNQYAFNTFALEEKTEEELTALYEKYK